MQSSHETIEGRAETASTRRRLFLDRSVNELGLEWAERLREQLHREGRPAAGGWPGTLGEARARCALLFPALARQRMQSATDAERLALARALYAAAKRHWLAHRESEDSPDHALTIQRAGAG